MHIQSYLLVGFNVRNRTGLLEFESLIVLYRKFEDFIDTVNREIP